VELYRQQPMPAFVTTLKGTFPRDREFRRTRGTWVGGKSGHDPADGFSIGTLLVPLHIDVGKLDAPPRRQFRWVVHEALKSPKFLKATGQGCDRRRRRNDCASATLALRSMARQPAHGSTRR